MKHILNNRTAVINRPYDAAIPPVILEAVKRRRDSPDGDYHKVVYSDHYAYDKIATYPWDKMKAGDFFIVPLNGRKPEALRTRFKNVALRRDFEITVVNWNAGTATNLIPALRVTLSYDGQISKLRAMLGLPEPNYRSKRKNFMSTDGLIAATR